MKIRYFIPIVMLATLYAPAQIPVTDMAHITTTKMVWVETMLKWKTQYEQMTGQINQLKSQYQAITGCRNLGNVFNNPQFRSYIGPDWSSIYDGISRGDYNGLTGPAKNILRTIPTYNSELEKKGPLGKAQADQLAKIAQDKAIVMSGFDTAQARINQIDALMGKINETEDTKAIQDLQARIAVEQAKIQNEMVKMQFFQMASQVEEKIQAEQQRAILQNQLNATKGLSPKPAFGN